MSFLLDANTISEIRRGKDRNVVAWAERLQDTDIFMSVLTLGEIRKGIERLRRHDPAQARVFDSWLSELQQRFRERILPVDVDVADDWGRINAPSERKAIDSLITATARVHGLTVATRNTADFCDCQVSLLDPSQHSAKRRSR